MVGCFVVRVCCLLCCCSLIELVCGWFCWIVSAFGLLMIKLVCLVICVVSGCVFGCSVIAGLMFVGGWFPGGCLVLVSS